MLSLFGKEERHHTVAVVPIGGWTEQNVHWLPFSDFNDARRSVVSRFVSVELIALVHEHSGHIFCGITADGNRFHERNDIFPFPAEIVLNSQPRMRTAVAHGDKDVVFPKFQGGREDFFSADVHFRLGIVVIDAVP